MIEKLNWDKGGGLLPAIIQDARNFRILMLGYMNKEAFRQTLETRLVTFFSRSKQAFWTKGESSGNFLDLVSAEIDCDQDTILIKANPRGPVCHTGAQTCFGEGEGTEILFLETLSSIIKQRNQERPKDSYTTKLFEKGRAHIAQKVGEEGVELSLAHVSGSQKDILNEAADLLFHMLVLLDDAALNMNDVCQVLQERHKIPQ